ncbi:MAG TPA: hypothetical protein DDX92_00855 [Flavobacteriales bacterium]|jgi:hypothetical protein|nr:hypothetical protein [Flavobacteriales bacterium]
MKKFFTLFIVTLIVIPGFAQDAAPADTLPKLWKIQGAVGLNFNQVGLYRWQGGGVNSMSYTFLYRGTFDYSKDNIYWNNFIDLAYGQLVQTGNDQKTDDRWEVGTQLGRKVSSHWDLNAFANLRSQFQEGFDPDDLTFRISDLMAPGYLQYGLAANYSPTDWLQLNLSPITSKITFVNDDSLANLRADPENLEETKGRYGQDLGQNTRVEYGAYAKISIKKEIIENVLLDTKAEFFTNYAENFGSIDVFWDLALLLKVNKWLSASITTNLIYDEDIIMPLETDKNGNALRSGPSVQFKQTVGVGISLTY